jgi:hypothetical protein
MELLTAFSFATTCYHSYMMAKTDSDVIAVSRITTPVFILEKFCYHRDMLKISLFTSIAFGAMNIYVRTR